MSCDSCPGNRAQTPAPAHTPPSLPAKVWSAMTAAARFTLGGMRTLSAEQQAARAAVCEGCAHRKGDECTACGCTLSLKTWMPAEHCPHNLWPK